MFASVIKLIYRMKKTILITVAFFLCFICDVAGQTIKVNGNVTSQSDGQPLPGAAVLETGTGNGTVTDFDGNFSFEVKEGSTITVSFVGFENQVLQPGTDMKIVLVDEIILEDVVVTGYQVQRKADLTGAVAVVSVNDMKKQNENNPIKALQGRVPGMNISADGNPSGSTTVRIRGIGTLNNNDPLYIIDGVPTKSGMHELNGNDIESIQVLKDAASASIYGSRAANGVIIITTKRGKEGKLNVDFEASVSVSTYANKMEVLNSKEFGQCLWQAFVNDGLDPNTNGLGYEYEWSYDANGAPKLDNLIMTKYLDAAGKTPAADTDWFDETTRTGVIQQYNLSISNGSERGNSFFSVGYYKNLGIIKHSDFERVSARANSEYKLLDNIVTIGENITLNRTKEVQAPGGFLENVLQFNPSIPVRCTDGTYAGPVGGYPDRENPVARLERNSDNQYTYWRFFGDAHININPVKDLNLKSTFGVDYSQKQQRIFTYPVTEGTVANPTNAVEAKQEHWQKWMWNAIATYNYEGDNFRGDVLAGIELNREDDVWFSGKKYDFAILNPDYMWPDAASGEAEAYGNGGGYSLLSFFGKMNFTYDEKYMASITARRDGSSRFGSNNQYGVFPSASLGWRISSESFLENASWLNDLKLRASWGQTGNQEISNTARYTLYVSNYGEASFGGQSYGTSYDMAGSNGGQLLPSGYQRRQLGNPDIKWETTTQVNAGIDFQIIDSKVYGSVDWYSKKTKDILLLMAGIGVMGEGSSQWINAGEMENKGWEFNLGYRDEATNGLSWDINGNIGLYRNKITKLPSTVAANGDFGGNGVKNVIGHPMGAQAGYVAAGLFKSQEDLDNAAKQDAAGLGRIRWADLNGDDIITEADQKWIYDPTPKFTYGLNVNLQYKKFDFAMFWQGSCGQDVISDLKKETDLWSGLNISNLNKGRRLLNAWSPSNADSDIPALTTHDNNNEKRVSSYFVENGSYLKLRNVQLGYNMPDNICQKLKMSKLRFYASAQNLLTIKSKDFTGVDPENPNFGYPIAVNYTFGLNVSF